MEQHRHAHVHTIGHLRQDGGLIARTGTDLEYDIVRRETWLKEIEAQWGPAPGRQNSDGQSIFGSGQYSVSCSASTLVVTVPGGVEITRLTRL